MKKIIVITYIILVLFATKPIYALSNITENMEFEVGLNGGISNYFMETNANSILKWRDLTFIGGFTNIKYNFSPDLNFNLGANYSVVTSGEMTDDDLVNRGYVYSKTKNMDGYQLKLDSDLSQIIYRQGNNNLFILVGARYQENNYKPNTIYQLGVEEDGTPFYYSDNSASQYTKSTFYGPTLGITFERISDNQSFNVGLKGFLAFEAHSKQSNWGYNWKVEGSTFPSVYGIDLNISQGLKMSEKLWLNMFATFEYLYGSRKLEEFGIFEDPNYKVGDIKYLQNYKASLGISLKIK